MLWITWQLLVYPLCEKCLSCKENVDMGSLDFAFIDVMQKHVALDMITVPVVGSKMGMSI